jgi:2-oxoglutarate dehydrogenase E2 component (dihydrolipoamide succinyltransferase)
MIKEITVPAIGESVSSGVLAVWLKKDGEYVNEGEELFELETDKANLSVPSPGSGVLHVMVEEGTEVEVGRAVGTIDTEGTPAGAEEEPLPSAKGEPRSSLKEESPQSLEDKLPQSLEDELPLPSGNEPRSRMENEPLSPAVRRVVEEHRLDPGVIPGTGKGGRITKKDALKAVEADRSTGRTVTEPGPVKPAESVSAGHDGARDAETKPAAVFTGTETIETSGGRVQRRVPMTRIRQRIAENLVRSKQGAAHLTTFNEIDMTEVSTLRAKYKGEFEEKHGTRLGFMSFFIKASVAALKAYPEVNAFIDGTDVLYNDYFDIGVALSTDRGLIMPVVRAADRKGFAEIEAEIVSFAQRAKEKRLTPDELSGATFTITNGGVFGSLLSTPIPSPPQTAILGMHAIQRRPVAVDDRVEIRPMMYVALTYDHRLIDGREAIGFLMTVKRAIEEPSRLLLDV